MKIGISIISFILIFYNCFSQNFFPEINKVYNDKVIPRIDITIASTDLETLYADVYSDAEYPATFVYNNGNISDTITNVGFRLRGNTSRVSEKKSFKIGFNSFVNQDFYDMDNMNLNGEHNDPSIIRSKIVWDILRSFKVIGARANHVELYINNVYYGLYISVEHIDDKFLKARYGSAKGNLYKCTYPANLEYLGTNPDSYKFESDGDRVYDLKTNESLDDYSDLAELINIINNIPVSEFPEKLEPIFNVNLYLKTLAVEILTSHWDDYSFNNNNYYLYHNSKTDKFDYIPYDVDNTFGIDWFNIDWATRNIYNWSNSSNRPLTNRILANSEYKARFSFYINLLINTYFTTDSLYPYIDEIKAMITPYAEEDLFRTLDYGYTINDFNNSYTTALGDHVKYGLKPYISTRISSAKQQLSLSSVSPLISIVNYDKFNYSQPFTAEIIAEDDGIITDAKMYYRFDGGEWNYVLMNDLGENNDSVAYDDVYTGCAEAGIEVISVDFYFELTDNNSNTTREPVQNFYNTNRKVQNFPKLFINEIMVDNESIITDELSEYEDWVEIYNAGDSAISTSNIYLTDDYTKPDKWKFPETTIPAKSFLLVWCDTAVVEGNLHSNFKLSKSGEELGLYTTDDDGDFVALDKLKYFQQETDISFGRKKDGEKPFVNFSTPTPNSSNNESVDYEVIITAYPNPCEDYFYIWAADFTITNVYITDVSGRTFTTEFNSSENKIYLNNINAGIYFVKIIAVNSNDAEVYGYSKIIKQKMKK